jgi:hypothetical protein
MATINAGIYFNKGTQEHPNWDQVTLPSVATSGNTFTSVTEGFVNVGNIAVPQWRQFYPSAGTVAYNAPGTYTFTVPPGIYKISIDACGAGGGGGGGEEVGNGAGGGGGGSGGFVQTQSIPVTPGAVVSITIGAGGAGAPYIGRTTHAPGGSNGGDTVVAVGNTVYTFTGGSGGSSDATSDGGGGGGGCCVVATALTEQGTWSFDQLVQLVDWSVKRLDTNFIGERLHRGYHVIGAKVFIPLLKSNTVFSEYIAWTFTNGTSMLKGEKYNPISVLNSMAWIAVMTITGLCVTKRYAKRTWLSLYRKNKNDR